MTASKGTHGFTIAAWEAAKEEAREAMIARARVRAMITYTELVRAVSSISLEPHDPRLAKLLGEISTEEDAGDRGMLTVIVVHKVGDMEPGKGFYELAQSLGRKFADPQKFWIEELHRVHGKWSEK
jgi:molybdopterin synthase catalytic subunit